MFSILSICVAVVYAGVVGDAVGEGKIKPVGHTAPRGETSWERLKVLQVYNSTSSLDPPLANIKLDSIMVSTTPIYKCWMIHPIK